MPDEVEQYPPEFDRFSARVEILQQASYIWVNEGHPRRLGVLDLAQELWDWAAETPDDLIILIGIPTEQDDPQPDSGYYKEYDMAEAVTLKDSQQVSVAVKPVDKKGYPVTDELTWTSSDESVVGLTTAEDGYSALFVAGAPGSAAVTVSDPNGLTDVIAVTVTTGDATGLSAVIGTPEEQPDAPASGGDTSGEVTTPPPASDSGDGGDTSGTPTETGSDSGANASTGTTDGAPPTPVDAGSGTASDTPDSTEADVPSDGSAAPLSGDSNTAPGPGASGVTPPAQMG